MKSYIEQLGREAQQKAIKLAVEGLSYQAIADELNKDYDATITSQNVQSFIRKQKDKSIKFMKEDKHFQSKLVETAWDTFQQMKAINGELYSLFLELRKNPDETDKKIVCPHCNKSFQIRLKNYLTLLKTADTILNQIRHADRVLGRLNKKSLNISYNFVEISKKIALAMPQLMHDMERKGLIKINSRRFKTFYGEKKMEEEIEEGEDLEEDENLDENLEEPIEV